MYAEVNANEANEANEATSDSTLAVYDEYNTRPTVSTLVDPVKQHRLAEIKKAMYEKISQMTWIKFEIARLVRQIQEERLYEAEIDPHTGRPFERMMDYEPFLVQELKTEYRIPDVEMRPIREYMALDRVFIQNNLASEDEIMALGPSHFTKLRQAIDYNSHTGTIREVPEGEGKIGVQAARQIIDMLRDSEGRWALQDTERVIAENTGTVRRSLEMVFHRSDRHHGGRISLEAINIYRNGEFECNALQGHTLTDEVAEWLCRHIHGTNNYALLDPPA